MRKLYSSSTRFRPPLIPDCTRDHPPAMSSRNTYIPFAQHLDALPLWIHFGIWSPTQKRARRRHGPSPSATSHWSMTEHLNWYPSERGTCVVMVGDQAYLMKVMNLDTRLIQTKTLILHLLFFIDVLAIFRQAWRQHQHINMQSGWPNVNVGSRVLSFSLSLR